MQMQGVHGVCALSVLVPYNLLLLADTNKYGTACIYPSVKQFTYYYTYKPGDEANTYSIFPLLNLCPCAITVMRMHKKMHPVQSPPWHGPGKF